MVKLEKFEFRSLASVVMKYWACTMIFALIAINPQKAGCPPRPESDPGISPSSELILVTGGAGFIGSTLVDELLEMNMRVRVVDNLSTGFLYNLDLSHPNLEFKHGDILDKQTIYDCMKGVTGIFHLAGTSELSLHPEMASRNFEVNALGTANVLEAAALSKTVKRFIYVGSAVNNNNSDAMYDPFFRSSPQASSKCMGELMTESYEKIFDLSTVSVRFLAVFGLRQPITGSYAPREIIKNLSSIPHFMHVGEVVKGLLKAYSAPNIRGTSLLMASRAGRSNDEVIRLINLYDSILSHDEHFTTTSNSFRRSFSEGDYPSDDTDTTNSSNDDMVDIVSGWMELSSDAQTQLLDQILSEGYLL
jgi:nucleoside-diphosphate-sugar epimerase